ncbi:SAC3/GANP/Nin1/mts3/eIF-3 p25 family-domain-containing protein [Phialemonium atrogriseum]|uniref:SAC3/GANP/Nin1/mts3/eIF-3 p25 family-domain-containing protein n=1 Tax=Phialemonium atrogriseum TaxID=1093897 RepID=A0AAJ0BXZ9_9PEZI|nr:SAC3/GANP/Nin1/mts3/eIF-3 p25 family-domain-containing protein [Phialemonium atrogriseum]KAK1766568.1 SAC3/GANP/Nin1/mts3/eIF-3 p25 family-domain-containing protein [Phialemonium atrogriseum]
MSRACQAKRPCPARRQPFSLPGPASHPKVRSRFQSSIHSKPDKTKKTFHFGSLSSVHPATKTIHEKKALPNQTTLRPNPKPHHPLRGQHNPKEKSNPIEPEPANPPTSTMAERQLSQILAQLKAQPATPSYPEALTLLSKAKLLLLQLNALTPSPTVSPALQTLARSLYEQGALYSIRALKPDAFLRYVAQLGPFYESLPSDGGDDDDQRNRVTGLYLLLLMTQGRYAEFHSELEALAARGGDGAVDVENDRFLGYPIRLERWLMEGSYDRVWKAMKKGEVPCEEYSVFSEILTSQMRSEIASSSERAYPSLPLSSTKSLLFLDSEGAVVQFARERGWTVRDGQIIFPAAGGAAGEAGADDEGLQQQRDMSQVIIENALGYARELETIV